MVGPGKCRDTMLVREFLFKNFVPFTWYDSVSAQGQKLMAGVDFSAWKAQMANQNPTMSQMFSGQPGSQDAMAQMAAGKN